MTSAKRKYGFMTVAILLALFFVAVYSVFLRDDSERGSHKLEKRWLITYHDRTFQAGYIKDFRIPNRRIHYGDSLVMKTVLPKNLPNYSALYIHLFSSAVDVYLDGRRVYSAGRSLIDAHEMVGSGYYRVELPADWAGKKLQLTVIGGSPDAFSLMPKVTLLTDRVGGMPYFGMHISPEFCLSIFLIIFGSMAMVGGFGGLGFAGYFFRVPLIGFFSIVMGVWALCYTHGVQLISSNQKWNSLVEFGTLYFSPIAIELLIISVRRGRLFGWRWKFLCALPKFNLLFFAVATTLQFLHVMNYSDFLWIFHIYAAIGFAFLFFPGIIYYRKIPRPEKISGFGFLLFCGTGVLELLMYNLNLFTPFESLRDHPIMPWGVLIYLVSLVISYAMFLQRSISNQAEKDLLSTLAYRDSLTGLYNRAKCGQIFDALNAVSADYAVVSIDMNGLKKINDTYGHGKGDEVLQAFARTLSLAFQGIGTPIRMGGDEFLVIVRQEHLSDMCLAFDQMERLQQEESTRFPIPLSAALGSALHSEVRANADAVYRKADERMYKMKQELKLARKD